MIKVRERGNNKKYPFWYMADLGRTFCLKQGIFRDTEKGLKKMKKL